MPQDYSGKNLRGRSFRGQNLEGANFSYADIRGANFTGANLRGTNFTGAKAGLKFRWFIIFIIASLVLSTFSALITAVAAGFAADLYYLRLKDSFIYFFSGIGIPAAIGTIYAVTVRYGLVEALFTVICICIIPGTVGWMILLNSKGILQKIAACSVILAWTGAGAFFEIIFSALSGVIFGTILNTPLASITGSTFGLIILVQVARLDWKQLFSAGQRQIETGRLEIIALWAIGIVAAGVFLGSYISYLSLNKNDDKYTFIRNIAVVFAATNGTSFLNANLTDADFTGATLKNTDFRGAILIRTKFRNTEKIDLVRPGSTYLKDAKVQQLLITGQVQNNNFDGQNLRGVNLEGASLTDVSFIGTDLSEANLTDADLSRAKLVQTQLDETDFTGATLTGAYIEDWGITNETNFRDVRCAYVYMHLPTKENPNPLRKPDNNAEVFADGEFGDFIKPIVDTLDLYHNQGVDPRAIAISFKELAENNPDAELEIVAMERRGKNKFILRAKTAQDADKSQLSAEYFEIYNHVKALAQKEVQALMTEKDSRIRSLETMVITALKSPSFYAEGDTNMSDNRNIQTGRDYRETHVNDQGTYVEGDYYNNAEQKQTLADAAAEIQALLEQLEKSYPTDTTKGKMALATEAITLVGAARSNTGAGRNYRGMG